MMPVPKNVMDLPDILRGRYISTLVHCPVCSKPMARRHGNKWWILTKIRGKTCEVLQEYNDKYTQGGYRIHCPDTTCKGAHIVEWYNEVVKSEDDFNVRVAKD